MCCRLFEPAAPVTSIHSERYRRLLALLVQARKDAEITQVELAKRLAKPQSFVSKFENGERRLDVIEFLDISEAIGVSAADLLADV